MKTEIVLNQNLKVGDEVWDIRPASKSSFATKFRVKHISEDIIYMIWISGNKKMYRIDDDGTYHFENRPNDTWYKEIKS